MKPTVKSTEPYGCIYSVMNLANNKEYIGKDKSGDPDNHRWKHHIKMSKTAHPKGHFHRAIKAMGGPEKFKWTVIWRGPVEKLCEKEIFYIAKRHTFVDDPLYRGYNLTRGGDGGIKSVQTKKKMGKSAARRWADETERARMCKAQRLRWDNTSEEVRKALSIAAVARWNTLSAEERARWNTLSAEARRLQKRTKAIYWRSRTEEEYAQITNRMRIRWVAWREKNLKARQASINAATVEYLMAFITANAVAI